MSLRAMVPAGSSAWAIARPRALFEHPRLGRALARAFDDAGEQALFERARRVGYDLRAVERAMVATRGAATVAVGLGPFDTRRIDALLWDRMLPPRARDERDGLIRAQGLLGETPTALAVWNACSVVAWSEGPGAAPMRALDEALRARGDGADDDDVLARWHGALVPAALRERVPSALLEGARDVDVTATLAERGLRVRVTVEGSLPPDAEARARRALEALTRDPLGEAVGAPQWLRDDRVRVEARPDALTLEAVAPWAALDAIAEVLRGRVGG